MSSQNSRGTARIISQKNVARGYREIRLNYASGGTPDNLPAAGSFFTIRPVNHPLQIMRRPFAYSGADERGFSFIYEIRGDATADIAGLPEEGILDWLGPLGNPFPQPADGRRPVLLAGGIGIGPIYYLASVLADNSTDRTAQAQESPLVIIGARTADLVPDLDWPTGVEVRICTDDGSAGIRGTALAALEPADAMNAEFFTCGPHPMMAAVHRLAAESGGSCWASMEEMMACGVGACQGCAVKMAERSTDGGALYKRACVEGPVFNSRELSW